MVRHDLLDCDQQSSQYSMKAIEFRVTAADTAGGTAQFRYSAFACWTGGKDNLTLGIDSAMVTLQPSAR